MAIGVLSKTDTGLNVCLLNLKHVGPDCMQRIVSKQKSGKKGISKNISLLLLLLLLFFFFF